MPELDKTIIKNLSTLKAYYRFESGALTTDTSSSGFALTAVGSPTAATGKFGGGVTLSSGNNYYRDSTSDLNATTGAISFGAWVKTNNAHASAGSFIGKMLHSGAFTGYDLSYSNGNIEAYFITDFGASTYDRISVNKTYNDDVWHLVIATRPASGGKIFLYFDGAQIGSATNNNRNVGSTAKFSIGSRNATGSSLPFVGTIDESFVLLGTELSADQVKELYEGRYIGELFPQSGLVGLWHLNGNANDSSGNNNNGTSTAITYSLANGKFNQGAGFNGTSSIITVPDASSLDLASAFTVMFWVYLTNNTTQQAICNKMLTAQADHNWYFDVGADLASDRIRFQIYNNVGAEITILGTAALEINRWYHIAGTFSSSTHLMKLYENGALASSTSISGTASTNTYPIAIGARKAGGAYETYLSNGSKVDEVAVFNRALSDREIRTIYRWSKYGE